MVRIFSGREESVLLTLEGESGGDRFGDSVSSAGDYDGDGVLDVLVGEPRADSKGQDGGSMYVVSGADGSVLLRDDGQGGNELAIPLSELGTSVAAADLNADGLPDLIAGAPWGNMALAKVSSRAVAFPATDVISQSGASIAALLPYGFADVDSEDVGIAIHSTTGTGRWQFSLAGGQSFTDVGAVDRSRSLLLGPGDRLRYVPGADEAGRASLELSGWDLSAGSAGNKVDTSERGGSAAFTLDWVTVHLPLAGANRPPAATNLQQKQTYVEGSTSVPLDDIVVTDVDVAEEITATLTLAGPNLGSLTADSNSGETYDPQTGAWTMTGSVGQVNRALADVVFQPASDNDQDTTITVVIGDGGEHGGGPLAGTIVLDAMPVNDAPVMRPFDVRPLPGSWSGANFGQSVSGAGDVNGDGLDDIVVGARCQPRGDACTGSAFVFSGADDSLLHEFPGSKDDYVPAIVHGGGDVNGDGLADVVVSGTRLGTNVYSGADGSSLLSLGTAPTRFAGDINGDGFDDVMDAWTVLSGRNGSILQTNLNDGTALGVYRTADGIGDINGDGFDDFIVGSMDSPGHAVVFAGSAKPAWECKDRTILYQLRGDAPGDQFGSAVSGVGDVNGDGTRDFAVAASQSGNSGPGYVRVYSGARGTVLHTFVGDLSTPVFGWAVRGAGDMNGDGMADILVGGFAYRNGWARVYSGADGSILYHLSGQSPNEGFGDSVSGAGDVNGDGLGDIIVGSPWSETGDAGSTGSATVFLPVGPWDIDTGPIDGPSLGTTVARLFPELATDVDTARLAESPCDGARAKGRGNTRWTMAGHFPISVAWTSPIPCYCATRTAFGTCMCGLRSTAPASRWNLLPGTSRVERRERSSTRRPRAAAARFPSTRQWHAWRSMRQ